MNAFLWHQQDYKNKPKGVFGMKRLMGYGLLPIAFAAFINGCSGTGSDKRSIGNDVLAGCPDRPNCVSSQARDQGHAIEPFRLKKGPAAGWNSITNIIGKFPRTTIIKANNNYLHVECKSRLLGFIDDLELKLNTDTGVIDIRSASRTGYYDFGVNRRRVSDLRQILRDQDLIH
jgi:uncharacterized protein (DUF1499 family)